MPYSSSSFAHFPFFAADGEKMNMSSIFGSFPLYSPREMYILEF